MMATDERRDTTPPTPGSSGSKKKKRRSSSKERFRLSTSALPQAGSGAKSGSAGSSSTQLLGEVWEAKHSYDAEAKNEDGNHTLLSFKRGQLILVEKKSTTGWWKGRLLNGSDTVGRFPMNFLMEVRGCVSKCVFVCQFGTSLT